MGAVILEGLELFLILFPKLYERRLRESVLVYMAETLEDQKGDGDGRPLEIRVESLKLGEPFLKSLITRRWGPAKVDYPHPIELLLDKESQDNGYRFWAKFNSIEKSAKERKLACRNIARRDVLEVVEREKAEILDIKASLDRARIAYTDWNLCCLKTRKRLIDAAIEETRRRAEEDRKEIARLENHWKSADGDQKSRKLGT